MDASAVLTAAKRSQLLISTATARDPTDSSFIARHASQCAGRVLIERSAPSLGRLCARRLTYPMDTSTALVASASSRSNAGTGRAGLVTDSRPNAKTVAASD